jgi:hypothetical protein
LEEALVLRPGAEVELTDRLRASKSVGRRCGGTGNLVGGDLRKKPAQSRILGSSLQPAAGGYWSRIARRVARAEEARPG